MLILESNGRLFEEKFGAPTESLLNRLYNEFQKSVDDETMGETVCLVCDRFQFNNDIKFYKFNQLLLARMRFRLAPSNNLCYALIEQYNISYVSTELSHMLLSANGVHYSELDIQF